MAPFNKCSCCEVRTRKVIRDRATRRNTYVCPSCFKAKKYQQNDKPKKVKLPNIDQKNDAPYPPLEHQQHKLDEPLEHQESLNEAQKEQDKPLEKADKEMLQMDVDKEIPLTLPTTNANSSLKITPPLMEIVIMNNRKYIAVSATADAEYEYI